MNVTASIADDFDYSPDAVGTIQNQQNSGLNCTSAIAELDDNGEDSGAKQIEICLIPEENTPLLEEIVVLDDGCGMNEDKLCKANKLAYHHSHQSGDIGKFGTGLKNAYMSLGNETFILTKTLDTPCIGMYINLKRMKEAKTFKPTAFHADGTEIFPHIPPALLEKFNSYSSGTLIYIRSLFQQHKNDVERIRQDIEKEWSLTYCQKKAETHLTIPGKPPIVVTPTDVFYEKTPENLLYSSISEIRLYPTASGLRVFESSIT